MTNNPAIVRSLLVYVVCLPVAIFLGFLLSDPLAKQNVIWFAVGILLLLLPLLLRWYHAWLITIWNMTITFIYLPGLLPGWMPMACIAFAVAVGHYVMNRERKFLPSGSVSVSLVFLALIVFITAKIRGGLGFNALGDESIGGKRYLFIWVATLGYFALISQPVSPQKRRLYTTLFLLGALTSALNNLSTMIGPLGSVLYIFFPGMNTASDLPMGLENIERFGGLATACMSLIFVLVACYGIEGVLDLRKIWRPILFFSALVLSAFGGYRGIIVMVGMTLVLVFCFEGLLRSRLMPVAVIGAIVTGGLIVCFSDQFPLPVQRCLAFLPVKISPIAKMSADASSDWRIEMWKSVLPEIPRYLFLGKGLTFDANDMAMYLTMGDQAGEVGGGSQLSADYHNGPLSVIIPFGIWGMLAFLWFVVASIRVLWKNYKYGDPDLRRINTFLLCYFIAKTIMFFAVFGGFYSDLVSFAGIVGLSISLNRGVATKSVPVPERSQVAFNRFRPLPLGRPAAST
jgi:O-Antigen ligase